MFSESHKGKGMGYIIKYVKTIIKTIVPPKYHYSLIGIKNWLNNGYSARSYSQEGEDMILKRIFEKQERGFYVDVGAHHPKRFSNTYYFYKKGWRGINIDAMPGSMRIFNKLRSRDINLEMAISDEKKTLRYYAFNDPALSGFSKQLANQRKGQGNYKIVFEKDLQTYTLNEVLDEHLPKGQKIDFLSVDVEGLDFEVLKSNNWNKYSPKVVLVESTGNSLEEIKPSNIYKLLKQNNYQLFAKTINTLIFKLT
jgi:FkbM family methyltransferase